MRQIPGILLAATVWLSISVLVSAAPDESNPKIPDFAKGDVLPPGAKHDWNLGPTGLRGWMFSDKLVTKDARQILITAVDSGSPADGILAVGDVLTGVHGKPFSFDPRTEFGRAITAAETGAGAGQLVVTRWRSGTTEEVSIKLPVLGSFSDTAPYDCPKSQQILAQGLKFLASRMAEPDYAEQTDPIPRSLNALALLSGGVDPSLPLLRREARWAAEFRTNDFKTWHYGYLMIFLAEYVMATDDVSAVPGLQRLALEAAKGQSAVGSWGHTFALPDGRLQGYGMMNSPGLPLTIGLVLAREAGVEDTEVTQAIERSARLLRFYTGKGAVPYGDHAAWTETHEDNGKCGMAAVLFSHLAEPSSANYFTQMALASHGNERDCGHTGNYFNLLWSLPAIGQAGPNATGAWMQEFGGWYHDLARRWDGSFTHQGPPEADFDSYHGWDATGAYLLGYALPLKKIRLTGNQAGVVQTMSSETARKIVADGRGWDNKDRRSFYASLTEKQLLERLSSWSPIVRERAALEISMRRDPPLPEILALLESETLEAQIGACQALESMRGDAMPAVPKLRTLLSHNDLWLRVRAASALAAIGTPALDALPELLNLIARHPGPDDPRGMEQRFVSFAVFGTLLPRLQSIENFSNEQLTTAIAQGLQNEDGRARSEISEVYRRLSYQQIQPLLPTILDAIIHPAPSGEMFADGVRLNGLKVLAAHRVEEGMQATADYLRTQNPWASEHRTPEILAVFDAYGAAAHAIIPHLEETAVSFEQGEVNFPRNLSRQKASAVRDAIKKIRSAMEHPELRSLNSLRN
ncbi:MAG: hypothetical protein RL215_2370 [Planctomycetota bacterium]|jgi:hypothetical protein